jgi:hypothetical protein
MGVTDFFLLLVSGDRVEQGFSPALTQQRVGFSR